MDRKLTSRSQKNGTGMGNPRGSVLRRSESGPEGEKSQSDTVGLGLKLLVIAHLDISRTLALPKAEEEVVVGLPVRDPMNAGGYAGSLEKSIHGAKDVSSPETEGLQRAVGKPWTHCRWASPVVLLCTRLDARLSMRSDDIMLLGG